jgi:hypothetical protein
MPADYLPTAVALTAAALPSSTPAEASPTATLTPSPTASVTPTPRPTATLTPRPEVPNAAIRILSPGPMSKVISPIVLKGYIRPGANGKILVELLGEDGRLLARDLFRKVTINTEGAYVNIKIPFEVRAAAELGRLQIITKDEFGRLMEIRTTPLLLLSVGENEISAASPEYARTVIYQPDGQTPVYGGTLIVSGEMQPFNETPVIVELLDEEGKTLGLRVLSLNGLDRQSFSTTISYKVSQQTAARLLIRQADERIGGLVYLHSEAVLVNP